MRPKTLSYSVKNRRQYNEFATRFWYEDTETLLSEYKENIN